MACSGNHNDNDLHLNIEHGVKTDSSEIHEEREPNLEAYIGRDELV